MNEKNFICTYIEENKDKFIDVSDKVWEFAEAGMKEYKSAKYIAEFCKKEGFSVDEGVAQIPTAFVAEYGNGHPIIGFLGEYDALPGLSQKGCCNEHIVINDADGSYGHGCGHNLLGAGALAAACALKEYIQTNNLSGTVRYYGCPGEEYGSGKTFMSRDGYFDDVDACFTWHPGDKNAVVAGGSLANYSIFYKFYGKTAHAAGSPHLGRSALDACELMNVGVNYLREHVIPQARMHYAYTDVGGIAPNVVQDHAGLHYFIRAPRVMDMMSIVERVTDISKGAALMTGTKMEAVVHEALCDFLPNETLNSVMHKALIEIGIPKLDENDMKMAESFMKTVSDEERKNSIKNYKAASGENIEAAVFNTHISPLIPIELGMNGSTDVGDTSYCTPTAQISMVTQIMGTPGHTWQITSQGKTSYAHKGMLTAGEVMALAAVYAMQDTEMLKKAKTELLSKNGGKYICPLPEGIKPTL